MIFRQIVKLDLLNKWPKLLFLLLTSSHYIITVNLFTDVLVLMGILGIIMQISAYITLVQLNQYVCWLNVTNFRWQHFAFFHSQINISLVFLADVSRFYGTAIFVFLLLNCPLNGLLAVTLLTSGISSWRSDMLALAYSVLALQWFFIFVIHFFCIKVCGKLHSPAKPLMRLFVCSKGVQKVKNRLKMAHYFEQFYSKNVITVTYGRFGKMNYYSFFKLVFFYCKFLFFTYKLVYKS